MPSFFMFRFWLFSLFIFLFLFSVCTVPAPCSDSFMLSQGDQEIQGDDPWAEDDKETDEWEGEWEDDDKSTQSTEDPWSDEEEQIVEKETGRFKLSGKLWNKFAQDLHEENDAENDAANHAALKVGTDMDHGDRLHAVLFIDVDYFSYKNNGDWNDDKTIRLDDAYINFRGDGFNLKLGNQITRWGKTDAYSPLDNLNPEDLRDNLSSRREDRKIPIPMANLEIYRENVTISGVFIPFFVEPEYDLLGTDWAILDHAEGLALAEEDPTRSLENSEGGIRLSGVTGSLDWAFCWLHAREDLPTPDTLVIPTGMPLPAGELTLSDLAVFSQTTGQTVFLTHDRQNIFGVEFETIMHSFGVRGDLAYTDHVSFFTRDMQRIRKPMVQLMTGIDYSGTDNWYANIQLLLSYIRDYEKRIIWAKETTQALNGTLWKEFSNGDLKLECRFYYDFSGDATVLNPKMRLSFWKPFIFEIGGEWFDGTLETVPGRFDDNDQVYAILEYKF